MKNYCKQGLPFFLGLLFALFTVSLAFSATTIADILESPSKYNGKIVTVTGKVTNLEQKVSGRANPYYTFELKDGDSIIPVFSFGVANIANGDKVRVTGKFSVKRKVRKRTFYNDINASKGSIVKL